MFRAGRGVGEGLRAVGERRSEPEFSRAVGANDVGEAWLELGFEADAAEREALARRLGLLALERFAVSAKLRLGAGDLIRAKVTLDADVLQSCVVTLEPVASRVFEAFEATFAGGVDAAEEPEVEVDCGGEDPPEPIVDGRLELGELATQHLSLALDPYPRRPGAGLTAGEKETDDGARPFAVLSKLAPGPS